MKRITKVLAIAAILTMLMVATIASPAFAANDNKGNGWKCKTNCGYCGEGQGGPDKWYGKCWAQDD